MKARKSLVERLELRLRKGDKATLAKQCSDARKSQPEKTAKRLTSISAYVRWRLGLKP